MVRVITQETYDEVVKENMEEFDMSPEEAIKEAIAQFHAQNVDLSNIIKDLVLGSGEDHLVTTTVNKLKDLCSKTSQDDGAIVKELDILKNECSKDLARRVKAGKDGAYNVLIDLLESRYKLYSENKTEGDGKIIVHTLGCLVALMDTHPDLLDNRGMDLIISILDKIHDQDILLWTLKWTSICLIKHEMNRQKLFGKNIGDRLKNLLKEKKNAKLISETLHVARKFTLDDDVRVEFGKAHEHAKELGTRLLEPLTCLMKEYNQPPLISEIMATIAALLVRNELCALVGDEATKAVLSVLVDNYSNVTVIISASKLITALAGNDDVKRLLIKSGIAPIIVSVLSKHVSNAKAAALIIKSISALCLREPTHSTEMFNNGAPEAIVDCMKAHPDNATVQQNACWAIRNMVSRCREQNAKFHELGVEEILNRNKDKFDKEFGFDVKSALRDLECDVKLNEPWTGKGVTIERD